MQHGTAPRRRARAGRAQGVHSAGVLLKLKWRKIVFNLELMNTKRPLSRHPPHPSAHFPHTTAGMADNSVEEAYYEAVSTRAAATASIEYVVRPAPGPLSKSTNVSALRARASCSRSCCVIVFTPTASCSGFLHITHMAFEACAQTFTTPVLTAAEKSCITNVTKKYVAASLRSSRRFADLQYAAAQAQLAEADKRRESVEEKIAKLRSSVLPHDAPAPSDKK
ncbi:Tim10/DDP family zinc finger protein [archaeon]|nr:MAG: Tim10/DDP family zinc finger protein [archaeon]